VSVATWVGEHFFQPFLKQADPPLTTLGGAVLGSTQQATYQARTARNFAQYGYMNNVTVYRAINIIAQSCASVDWQVYKVTNPNSPKKQRVPISNHPMALLLQNPNKNKARASFIEQLISYWLISGTDYMLASFPSEVRTPDSKPQAVYNLRPDLITLRAGINGDVAYYRYNISGGYSSYNSDIGSYAKYIDYPAWKVMALRFFHPLDELAGLSVIQVAAAVVERQNAGEEWNFSLMKNMARPSGAFVAAADFSDESRARLKREVFQKYGRGKNTAGMPMLLENGLTYVQLAINPVDADWLNSDAAAGRKIASAIGVDPLLLQDKQYSTYNNELEAKLAMWELTCFPLMEKLKDELNSFLTPFYGRDVEIDYDKEPIESLRRNRQLESVTTIAEWNTGLRSFNDAAMDLDIQTTPSDTDDFYRFGPTIFVRRSAIGDFLDAQEALWKQTEQLLQPPQLPPTTVQQVGPDGNPVGPDGKPIQQLQGANPLQPQKPVNPLIPGQSTNPSTGTVRINKVPPFAVPRIQNLQPLKAQEERDHIYYQIEQFRQQWYGHFTQGVKSYFDSELITLLQAIGHNTNTETAKAAVLATLQLHTSQLQTILAGYYASIADASARRIGQQFGTKTTIFTKTSIETLGVYAGKNIASIAATTQGHIEDIFNTALTESKSVGDVSQKLRELYNGYTKQRAETIAMNETVLAHNVGSHIAAKQLGIPVFKTWIAARDMRVRSEHQQLDGQRQYLEKPYTSGNTQLLFPKDDSYGAPVEFLIGCRCAEYYTVDFHPESRF
jgi:HK97 family phage portal protein